MATIIDKSYRKEKLLDWELQSLREKYSDVSFSKKSSWKALGLFFLYFLIFAFIMPYIPPRHSVGHWEPPRNAGEYLTRVMDFLLITPFFLVLLFAIYVCINLRNTMDLRLGVKRTATFIITEILNFGIAKVLILNNWRPFILREKQLYFDSVKTNQIITIKRTGTYRLIDCFVRDEQIQMISKAEKL